MSISRPSYAYIIPIIMWLLSPLGARGQSLSQNTISTIAKSDPLIITGSIGTQNTYYHSSMGGGFRSPWANSLYANLNVSEPLVQIISIPL